VKKIHCTLLLALCTTTLSAQTQTQTLYWLRYQSLLIFSKRLSWNNDIDNRRFIGPDVQNQFIFHSRLHYRADRWDFATGITYSVAYAAIPEQGYDHAMAELRPVAEVTYEIPVRKSFLAHRLRLDNRIFQESPGESVLEESFFVMRYRYRIQYRTALKRNESNATTIGLRIADEIMVNDRRNFYDQNRIYVTGEFMLSRQFSLEAGYIYIHQRRLSRDEYFSRNVLRFSVLHRINLGD
jgi:hypothetical protein